VKTPTTAGILAGGKNLNSSPLLVFSPTIEAGEFVMG
jgi:hypothetical protein